VNALRVTACVLALVTASATQAQLFSDTDARKAILELRAVDEQQKKTIDELQAQIKALSDQLQSLQPLTRSLLELNNQLEALRTEQAGLRGSNEQLAREVAELQRRQKDAGQALDDRLRRLEPVKVALDGQEFLVDPDEKRAHDEAMAALRSGDFDRAATLMAAFLRRYPASGYAASLRFWLGNAQYGKREYKEAITTLRAFAAAAPDHPRAPEALLATANCQLELKDSKSARRTLDELLKAYPKSEAALAGKERLATLK